jgi:hypothetical protein
MKETSVCEKAMADFKVLSILRIPGKYLATHGVYVFFSESGRPIYVGMTSKGLLRPFERVNPGTVDSDSLLGELWFYELESRAVAREAEAHLIKRLRPSLNNEGQMRQPRGWMILWALHLPANIKTAIRAFALEDRRSIGSLIRNILEDWIAARKSSGPPTRNRKDEMCKSVKAENRGSMAVWALRVPARIKSEMETFAKQDRRGTANLVRNILEDYITVRKAK